MNDVETPDRHHRCKVYDAPMDLTEAQKTMLPVLERHPLEYAGIFGSFARGEQTAASDVDILVKFTGRPTFAGYLKLDEELRSALGRDVDLVTEGGVSKLLRPYVEQDLKVVYGQR